MVKGPHRSLRHWVLPHFDDVLRSRYALLLLAISALFILSPLLEAGLADRIGYGLLAAAVLVAAIRASTEVGQRRRRIAIGIGTLTLAVMAAKTVWPGMPQQLIADVLFLAFSIFTMATVFAHVLTAKRVDFDILCGTAAVYLLLALIWAVWYQIIEIISPGSFSGMEHADFPEFLYFSLVTITSLGYGDILAVNPWARVWAGLEATAGVFYLAVVVARLVSAYER